jgi:hypothetical protein
VRQISSQSIVACHSRGLQLLTLFLVRDDGSVGSQRHFIQGALI